MANTKRCWDCDHFDAVDPEHSLTGYCRRWAPSGLSEATIPGFHNPLDVTTILWEFVFPQIIDGKAGFCYCDFKPTSRTPLPD